MDTIAFYGKEKISKILLKLAPPVMLHSSFRRCITLLTAFS